MRRGTISKKASISLKNFMIYETPCNDKKMRISLNYRFIMDYSLFKS